MQGVSKLLELKFLTIRDCNEQLYFHPLRFPSKFLYPTPLKSEKIDSYFKGEDFCYRCVTFLFCLTCNG